jgi:hypothetical protein
MPHQAMKASPQAAPVTKPVEAKPAPQVEIKSTGGVMAAVKKFFKIFS